MQTSKLILCAISLVALCLVTYWHLQPHSVYKRTLDATSFTRVMQKSVRKGDDRGHIENLIGPPNAIISDRLVKQLSIAGWFDESSAGDHRFTAYRIIDKSRSLDGVRILQYKNGKFVAMAAFEELPGGEHVFDLSDRSKQTEAE